jgi:AcrR family transcriptional regulator
MTLECHSTIIGSVPSSTHESIKRAALELMERVDIEALSVDEIRTVAGVSNGSFFHHFATKDALFATLYMDGLRSYHREIETALARRPTAADGVAVAIRTHLRWVKQQRTLGRLVFDGHRAASIERIRDAQQAENRRFAAVLDEWRTTLVDDGQIVEMDVEMLIAQIVGPAQIFCRAWLSNRSNEDPMKRADALIAASQRALGIASPR